MQRLMKDYYGNKLFFRKSGVEKHVKIKIVESVVRPTRSTWYKNKSWILTDK